AAVCGRRRSSMIKRSMIDDLIAAMSNGIIRSSLTRSSIQVLLCSVAELAELLRHHETAHRILPCRHRDTRPEQLGVRERTELRPLCAKRHVSHADGHEARLYGRLAGEFRRQFEPRTTS